MKRIPELIICLLIGVQLSGCVRFYTNDAPVDDTEAEEIQFKDAGGVTIVNGGDTKTNTPPPVPPEPAPPPPEPPPAATDGVPPYTATCEGSGCTVTLPKDVVTGKDGKPKKVRIIYK